MSQTLVESCGWAMLTIKPKYRAWFLNLEAQRSYLIATPKLEGLKFNSFLVIDILWVQSGMKSIDFCIYFLLILYFFERARTLDCTKSVFEMDIGIIGKDYFFFWQWSVNMCLHLQFLWLIRGIHSLTMLYLNNKDLASYFCSD